MPPLLGIAGAKHVGKTTLAAALIAELSARGLAVSSVKRAHHGVDIDRPGRDSFRHRAAGAREVALVMPERWAVMGELRGAPAPSLAEIVARLAPCDLVVVEGFTQTPFPKIEVRRAAAAGASKGAIPGVIAIAADTGQPDAAVPVLPLNDPGAVADFVIARLLAAAPPADHARASG
jgi:molybdopterin-guanine dinucleotide biosynthesis protein B